MSCGTHQPYVCRLGYTNNAPCCRVCMRAGTGERICALACISCMMELTCKIQAHPPPPPAMSPHVTLSAIVGQPWGVQAAQRARPRQRTVSAINLEKKMIDHLDHLVLTTANEASCIGINNRVMKMALQSFIGGSLRPLSAGRFNSATNR